MEYTLAHCPIFWDHLTIIPKAKDFKNMSNIICFISIFLALAFYGFIYGSMLTLNKFGIIPGGAYFVAAYSGIIFFLGYSTIKWIWRFRKERKSPPEFRPSKPLPRGALDPLKDYLEKHKKD